MADLGEAKLVLSVDDGPLRQGLAEARRFVEQELGSAVSQGTRQAVSRTRRATTTPPGAAEGGITRDDVRRFNLRGFTAALEDLSQELRLFESARSFNIGQSWTVALDALQDIASQLNQVSSGRELNIRSSWTTALDTLQELDGELRTIARGEQLNLNTSWNTALSELQEIDTDLRTIATGEKLNLNTSWNTALGQLDEIDSDLRLISSAEQLNLRNGWRAALDTLEQIDADLRFIGQAKDLNLRSNWQKALDELNETAQVIQKSDLKAEIEEGLRIGRINVSPVQGGFAFPGSPGAILAEKRLREARERSAAAANRAQTAEAKLEARRRATEKKRTEDILANTLIGFGFPLLFGQGIGGAVGGGVGGALGGAIGGKFGFGLSIAGTALGAAFDTVLQKAQTLADGLDDPIKNFGALQEAALLSSKSLERQVESLIAAGRANEAYALIQGDLAQTFGDPEAVRKYRDELDRLNREWSTATLRLTSFVTGPLADFLKRLRLAIGGEPRTTQEREISQQQRANAARTLSAFGLQIAAFGGAAAASGIGIAPGLAGLGTGALLVAAGKAVGEQDGAEAWKQIEASIPAAVAAAREYRAEQEATASLQNKQNRLIAAQAQNNRDLIADLQRQIAQEQAAVDIKKSGADVDRIRRDLQLEIIRINESEAQRAREVLATQQLQTAQTRLQVEALQARIQAAQRLAGTEKGIARDTLNTIQGIQEGIDAARRSEREIGAQIDAARVRGADPEEVRALVDRQVVAATETRAKIFEGALALQEAGERLRDNLRSAVLEFTRLRSDPEGLNRFLSPTRRGTRERESFQLLLPSFREAQARFTELTGARAPEFRGTTQDVNESIRDFVATVDREFQARQNLVGTQQSLQQVNENLVTINTQLAEATGRLAEKDWTVSVNVINEAGGSSTVNTVNGLAL